MKPYPEYKETGLDWLPRVPAHWDTRKIQSFARVKSIRNRPESQLLSVYRDYGVIPKNSRDDNHNVASEDLSNYKFVEVGDLVLNKMKTWQGSLAISAYEGIVSPAYIVCRVEGNWERSYLHGLLRTPMYIGLYNTISYGVRVGQWDMRWEDFKQVPVVVPPIEEQKQIVAYLAAKNREIESYITAKRALLAKLKELSAAVISRAVTHGLNPEAKTKPSGVQWLGDVPEHWEVKPLFAVAQEKAEKNWGMKEDRVLSLSYGAIKVRDVEKNNGLLPASFETYQIVECEDIILRLTDLQNDQKSLRTGYSAIKGIITSAYLCLKTRSVKAPVLAEFLSLLLHCYDIRKVFYGLGGGVRQSIGFDEVKRLPILVPPLEEQEALVAHIETQLAVVRDVQTRIEREIELARELWTTLVAEVVTGQIDVRDAVFEAAPDEPLFAAPNLEDDTSEDGDEYADDEAEPALTSTDT